MKNIVILGAGYAGLTAALRLARKSHGLARITLVNVTGSFVERIRLHEIAADHVPRRHALERLLRGTGVELIVAQVTAVDRRARTLTAGEHTLSWDRLVLALGSRTDLGMPGAREHARCLDGRGAAQLATELRALPPGAHVTVVGGGATGIEAATELAETWPQLRVSLLTRGEVGAGFSAAARQHFAHVLRRLSVAVVEQASVQRVEPSALVLATGEHPFDVCVWTPGFVANELPAGLELPVDRLGRVRVDPTLRSLGDPKVWVAGDLAAVSAPVAVPMGCKSAGPAGSQVADNLLRELTGEPLEAFDFLCPLYCVSLGRHDGLIQRTRPDGTLTGGVLRGRLAAWFKELVCRYTMVAFRLERLGLGSNAMFRAGNVAPPQLPRRTAGERAA